MSYLAQEWAEDHAPVADTYERIILMKLARRANDDGTGAWPSVASMAQAALCDTETVKRRLRSMMQRKLIALGDQRLVDHYPANKRPRVYDVLVPVEWYSTAQLVKVNRERADRGLAPLTAADRPPVAAAPPRRRRADHGVPNPKRRPKTPPEQAVPGLGALQEPPAEPVDNSAGGSLRALTGGSTRAVQGALVEPQIRPYKPVLDKSVRPERAGARANRRAGPVAPAVKDTDGRTESSLERQPMGQPQPELASSPANGTTAMLLVEARPIQRDLARIDIKPPQRDRLIALIDQALQQFPHAKVAHYLATKAREANTVKWLLAAFEDYSDSIRHVYVPTHHTPVPPRRRSLPAKCKHCRAREDDPPGLRMVETPQGMIRCECHPYATATPSQHAPFAPLTAEHGTTNPFT